MLRHPLVTLLTAALLGGGLPSGILWFGGTRPSEALERRVERLEVLMERVAGEQIERSNRLARLEAESAQATIRLGRIEEKIDRVLQGGK